jgi:hypothetical protein
VKPTPTTCPLCGCRWYDPNKPPGTKCGDHGICPGKLITEGEDAALIDAGIRYYQEENERLKDELRRRGWEG